MTLQFSDYVGILRRRWRLIVLGVILSLGGASVATILQTPSYEAVARLLVSAPAGDNAVDEITQRQLSTQRAAAYANYATTGPAVRAARAEASVDAPASVDATADGTTPFIVLRVSSPDAASAAALANAYAVVLPDVVSDLDQTPRGTPLPQLSVLEQATVPQRPASPDPTRNLLVALVLGAVLGTAAALLRETLDATVRQSAEVERLTDAELLGVVPKEFPAERLVSASRPRSRRTEAYRHVRTNLEFTGPSGAPRSLVITSAAPGEGKTTLAANLALIASHAGKRVVLVDADLRKPSVAEVLRLPDRPGLSEVLIGAVTLEDALQSLPGERLSALTSGALPASPAELLGSTAMVELIQALEQKFDFVVIDSAPVLPVTDALVVGVNTGGVVVVTRLAATTRNALKRAVEAVRRVDARLLGVVANGAVEDEDKRYGYGYGYLSERRGQAEDLRPADHIRAAGRREPGPSPLPPESPAGG